MVTVGKGRYRVIASMDGVDKYSRMTLVLIYGPEGFRNRSITKLWSSTLPSRRHTREGRSAHHPHHHSYLVIASPGFAK